jgi:cell wall-associated NlpC family hydrolase
MSGSFGSSRGSSVLAVAARYLGVAYRYGGTTPKAWDCSGATGYIFSQIGVQLPRTANQQMLYSKRVSRSEARAGDLVFMVSGGMAYHVGIYAGNNMMYDAQRTGKSFTKREIFTSSVVFGRV